MKKNKLIGFKGFNKDMTCKGFQYKEGKTYKMEEEPETTVNTTQKIRKQKQAQMSIARHKDGQASNTQTTKNAAGRE